MSEVELRSISVFRFPGWCDTFSITINFPSAPIVSNTKQSQFRLRLLALRSWKSSIIAIHLHRLIESRRGAGICALNKSSAKYKKSRGEDGEWETWMPEMGRESCENIFIIDITAPQYCNYFSLPFSLRRSLLFLSHFATIISASRWRKCKRSAKRGERIGDRVCGGRVCDDRTDVLQHLPASYDALWRGIDGFMWAFHFAASL